MLERLAAAHRAGQLNFYGDHTHLAEADAFKAFLAPIKKTKWFVYANVRLPGLRPCLPIYPVTLTASQSRTDG
jgi:hypothetical protein